MLHCQLCKDVHKRFQLFLIIVEAVAYHLQEVDLKVWLQISIKQSRARIELVKHWHCKAVDSWRQHEMILKFEMMIAVEKMFDCLFKLLLKVLYSLKVECCHKYIIL